MEDEWQEVTRGSNTCEGLLGECGCFLEGSVWEKSVTGNSSERDGWACHALLCDPQHYQLQQGTAPGAGNQV